MYNEMMKSWLRIVVRPLIHKHHHHYPDQDKQHDQGLDAQFSVDNRINDSEDPTHSLKKRDRTEQYRDGDDNGDDKDGRQEDKDSSGISVNPTDIHTDPPVKRMCQDTTTTSGEIKKKKEKKVVTLEGEKADILAWYEDEGMWVQVYPSDSTKDGMVSMTYDATSVWKNLFAWKAYTRKRRHLIMVNNSS